MSLSLSLPLYFSFNYSGDVGKNTSTLKADIQYFVQFLTIFALIQAALVFIVGVTRGISPVQGAQCPSVIISPGIL
jgi:hypothetical protein